MKVIGTLSIGFGEGASHQDELDIDMDEYNELKTDEERDGYLYNVWREWIWEYIDGGPTIIHNDTEETTNNAKS